MIGSENGKNDGLQAGIKKIQRTGKIAKRVISLLPVFGVIFLVLMEVAGASLFVDALKSKIGDAANEIFDFFDITKQCVQPGEKIKGTQHVRGFCGCDECFGRYFDETFDKTSLVGKVALVDETNPIVPVGSMIEIDGTEYKVISSAELSGGGVGICIFMDSHDEVTSYGEMKEKVIYSKSNTSDIYVDTRWGGGTVGLQENAVEALLEKTEEKDESGKYVLDSEYYEEIHLTRDGYRDILISVNDQNSEFKNKKQELKFKMKCDKTNRETGKTKKGATVTKSIQVQKAAVEGCFSVSWQTIMSLYQMAATERMQRWSQLKLGPTKDGIKFGKEDVTEEEKAVDFLTKEETDQLIEKAVYSYAYYYDATMDKDNPIKIDNFSKKCYYITDASYYNDEKYTYSGEIKVPISVPACITNAFDCIVADVDENTHELKGYRRVVTESYIKQQMGGLIDEWDWSYFIDLLSSYPESENLVEKYKNIKNSPDGVFTEDIEIKDVLGFSPPGPVYIGDDVECTVTGSFMEYYGSGARYLSLNYLDAASDVHLPLDVKDDITAEQMDQLIDQYLSMNGYDVNNSELHGTGAAFVKAQEDFGVSAIAMLGLACNESGCGTSPICRDKHNFFGWGAFDSSPYQSAMGFDGAQGGIYYVISRIAATYVYSSYGQNTFYKMRWNGGVHQYATDEEWDLKAAKHRASLMVLAADMNLIASSGGAKQSNFYTGKSGTMYEYNAVPGNTYLGVHDNFAKLCEMAIAMANDDTYYYEWGGEGPYGYDCSGFAQYLYRTCLGYPLSHDSGSQPNEMKKIDLGQLQPGDLVFTTGHVMVYVGFDADGNQIVAEAQKRATGIVISLLNNRLNGYRCCGTIR